MTVQDRVQQNKECWQRIIELSGEIEELQMLVAENLIVIYNEQEQSPN